MNREEAIDFGHFWLEVNEDSKKSCTYEFFKTAIEELEKDTVPFDFDLYQAGLMDMPEEMIKVLDKIRSEIEQLPTNTRTNWNGCCPDIDYPEIEYVDIPKKALLDIIDKYIPRGDNKE